MQRVRARFISAMVTIAIAHRAIADVSILVAASPVTAASHVTRTDRSSWYVNVGETVDISINDGDDARVWSLGLAYENAVQHFELPPIVREALRLPQSTATNTTAPTAAATASALRVRDQPDARAATTALGALHGLAELPDDVTTASIVRLVAIVAKDQIAREARASRRLSFSVSGSFQSITASLCGRSARFEEARIRLGEPECIANPLRFTVADAQGPFSVVAGATFPIFFGDRTAYAQGPNGELLSSERPAGFGDPQPSIAIGARYTSSSTVMPHAGGELVVSTGDRVGRMWGVGVFGGVVGISLGFGVLVDFAGSSQLSSSRTSGPIADIVRPVPLGGVYFRVGFALDFGPLRALAAAASAAPGGPNGAGR